MLFSPEETLTVVGFTRPCAGLLVNVGFYLHFRETMVGDLVLDTAIWPLVIFVAAFSKNFFIFFGTPIFSPQFVCGIEMFSSYDVNCFHVILLGYKGNNESSK
jgi:hypothetical protein